MVRYIALKNRYETEKTIGSGGFAKVKLATHLKTGEKVAIKVMDKEKLGDDLPRVQMEIEALKSLSHHHICKLYEVIETETHYFLVMEFCAGGELFDHIVQCHRLSEMESRSFFRQILSAVAYLHSKGYVHRDLKPENVLLDKNQCVKLIDFGLCAKPSPSLTSHLDTACGSPTYAAPELIRGDKYLGARVDVWSMGVMLYALLCGCLPFESEKIDELYRQILSGNYVTPKHLSEGSKNFLRCMLETDPSKRITVEELLSHPWVKTGYNEPVSVTSLYKDLEPDKNCVSTMASFYQISTEEMLQRLSESQYDGDYATYHLLLSLKNRGLPLQLGHSTVRSARERIQSMRKTVRSRGERDGTYLAHPTSNPPSVQEEKENGEKKMQPPEYTPVKVPRKRPRSLNRETSLSPAPKKPAPVAQQHISVPKKDKNTNKSVPSTPENKIYSSPTTWIKSGVQQVCKALTPNRRNTMLVDLPAYVKPRKMSNISSTLSRSPSYVKIQLMKAIRKRGIECSAKGYSIRGKIHSADGKQCKLSFELDVVIMPDTASESGHSVGIRRKRLKGDAWSYKCICEEVLNLADLK